MKHPLPQPFLVLATENPIDQEGTIHYPKRKWTFHAQTCCQLSRKGDVLILDANASVSVSLEVNPVVDAETISRSKNLLMEFIWMKS